MYINRIGDLCDKQQTRIIIVQSLVLSLIHYCIRIWRTTNHTLLSNVQKVQNFAAKVAIGGAKKIWPRIANYQKSTVDENQTKTRVWGVHNNV